jgi:hypothetical protein
MQKENTNIVPIPIYKGTYEEISRAYRSLHLSLEFGTDKMDLTWEQRSIAQRRVAEIYAMVTGITPLSTLVVINMLYDMITKVISISPSMKYIIDPEDVRRMDPNRRMRHDIRFDIHPILMSTFDQDEYRTVLLFACSKNGNRYILHKLYCDASDMSSSSYIGCEHMDCFKFNPTSNDSQELEQYVYNHICQFAVKRVTDGDYYDFHSLIRELNELSRELSEGNKSGNNLGNSSMIMLVRQKYGVVGEDGSITIKHKLPYSSRWSLMKDEALLVDEDDLLDED